MNLRNYGKKNTQATKILHNVRVGLNRLEQMDLVLELRFNLLGSFLRKELDGNVASNRLGLKVNK
jgi:hypothetical protein